MGLLSNLLGNATEIDIAKVQAELEPVLVPGESIGRGFKIFRDMFIFTDHRLIMIDKQGVTGSKVTYHITKEFKKGTDVVGIQKYLAHCVFGGSIKEG